MGPGGRHPSSRYPVAFRELPGAAFAGALEVEADGLLLEGRSEGGLVTLRIPYADLVEVRIGRGTDELLNGRPALWLERDNATVVQVEPFGPGLLHELADLLSGLAAGPTDDRQVAVVVPLRPGRLARAKELVAAGPPFDPAALGFTRHEVFLTPTEAVFVFSGPHVRETLEQASRDPSLWRVGLTWRGCIGGRPRLARVSEALVHHDRERVYSWTADRG
jgi:hypothetical protein